MKKQNNSARAWALQITLSAALISISAVLLASTFKAAPAASGVSAAIAPALEGDKNPASGTWTVTGSLNTGRLAHTATLLPNGKVLVAGGVGSLLASAELYDPASGSWTVTGNLNIARDHHTATLLPNGKVLVAGGQGFGALASAELYDPASGTWTVTGNLNTARYYHTATLLPNGMVLVAGGWNGGRGTPGSAEPGSLTPAAIRGDVAAQRRAWPAVFPALAARNSTTRRAEAGRSRAASTPHAGITRRRCCPTARC